MASAKPTQPPSGADMSALVKRVNELSQKVLGKEFASKLPVWKRWVGSEAEFDGKGLRDVVNANALYLDDVKSDADALKPRVSTLEQKVAALEEAPQARPFP